MLIDRKMMAKRLVKTRFNVHHYFHAFMFLFTLIKKPKNQSNPKWSVTHRHVLLLKIIMRESNIEVQSL